ncbi:purine-nucleoside phosphorylase [Hornefia porci]|uniref:Uridine phosphorylase n=1 Tax=Hornefia porci TaxID=2652292 RepID=A0A1Q9JH26_9FIRM|nr:purine-nucleoside phosphorylase [Hornefia porci]OLR55518.1 purine-nucleoside phosphorylase [Hornefia porci]
MSLHIAVDHRAPVAESVLMPGDPLRAQFIAENFLDNPVRYSEIRNMYGYTGTYKGVPVSVQGSGMGMPSMGIYSWELYNEHGVENIIRIGTAGSFREDINVGEIVVGLAASTDSNFQHAFDVPGQYSPCCSYSLLTRLQEAGRETGIPFTAGNIVSCDVFYETTDDWWKRWARMGVMAVEMEAAALYMNAAYCRKNALAIMTISDSFVTGEKATAEERQTTFTDMMKLALEAAVK